MIGRIIIFFGFGLLIQSCNDQETSPDKLTSYPMNIGTEWIYDQEKIIKIFESETSEQVIDIDTIRSTISVIISKDTILRDSILVKEFVANEIGSQVYSKEYFKLDNDGLKAYAYKNGGSKAFAKKKSAKIVENAMFKTFQLDPVLIGTEEDILYFHAQPRLSIKLPLSVDDKWNYVPLSESFNLKIDKEVVGFERLKFSFGTFDCYKIRYKYIDSVFDGIDLVDWVSAQGLIKRQVINERVTLIVEEGESIGNIQLIDILTIKELKLK